MGPLEDIIDLSETYIKAKIRFTNANGNAGYGEADMVAQVNLILQSMRSKLDVSFKGKRVSSSGHSYRANLESALNLTSDVKKGQLSASGWMMDSSGHFDTMAADNLGFMERKRNGEALNTMSLIGKLHADVVNQNRCLIDGVNVDIRLTRSSDQFCIVCEQLAMKITHEKITLPSCRMGIYEGLSLAPLRRTGFYPSAERGIVITMSVCVSVCGHDNSSNSHPIFTKLGRIVNI